MVLRTTILIPCLIAVFVSSSQTQRPYESTNPIITLERTTEAFGVIPPYKLSIYQDGTVIYQPIPYVPGERVKQKVKQRRTARAKLRPEAIQQLLFEFERINYSSLKDEYGMSGGFGPAPTEDCPEMYTDQTSAYTSLTINGKTKRVEHYLGCKGNDVAEKLTKLENRIDEIVNTKQWVK